MQTELWDIFELVFEVKIDRNPFTEVEFVAIFIQDDKRINVPGFYDGNGIFRIRFMPNSLGVWHYETYSNIGALNNNIGELTVIEASENNHGPVYVSDRFHFRYADNSQYRQIGTTCYAWAHQNDELQQQTLRTLDSAPFNKLRMCVFPKWYPYNHIEPELYPFEGDAPVNWDFTRLNPEYFQHLDRCIISLMQRGIEADLILFHPYDEGHWGFDRMGAANDDRYLRYVIARFSAFRNVWWSLANEWDFVQSKTEADWMRFGRIVNECDPYHHMISIHNGGRLFDHTQEWISHVSLQGDKTGDAAEIRKRYGKPLIYDECCYEGDIEHDWGNITADKLVSHFWKTFIEGAYCGHGETYYDPAEEIWWAKGGVLHGKSKERLAFFKDIIDSAPVNGDHLSYCIFGVEREYYLAYFWERQPSMRRIQLAEGVQFKAELIDTWAMTITPLPGEYTGLATFDLPGRQYMGLRITRI